MQLSSIRTIRFLVLQRFFSDFPITTGKQKSYKLLQQVLALHEYNSVGEALSSRASLSDITRAVSLGSLFKFT